ncbi:MAG: carboxypeptidase regulatory-like domain-containing protein [Candidatus Eisenbacteria bacterium]|nr:carboxypeptidase regulatory-like domain-containing protein [Candidatus Eisenbacteria bacterium]
MVRIRRAAVLAAAALLIAAGCELAGKTGGPVPSGSSRIHGTVEGLAGKNASVYVVGQPSSGTQIDENGDFSLLVELTDHGSLTPRSGRAIGDSLSDLGSTAYQLMVLADDESSGAKLDGLELEDQGDFDTGSISVSETGSLSGFATLQNETDHTGVTVYLPGTSFLATTDAEGAFELMGLPAGTYDFLRAEKDGYRYAVQTNVEIEEGTTTAAINLTLLLSTGPTGRIQIELADDGSGDATLLISATDDAVLMMLSESVEFLNAEWCPVQSTVSFTFSDSNVFRDIYIRFADANGLESSTYHSYDSLVHYPDSGLYGENLLTCVSPTVGIAYSITADVASEGHLKVIIPVQPDLFGSGIDISSLVNLQYVDLPTSRIIQSTGEGHCDMMIEFNSVAPSGFFSIDVYENNSDEPTFDVDMSW